MPVVIHSPSASPEASLGGLKSGIDMAATAAVGASKSLEALRDTSNFPSKKVEAMSALQAAIDCLSNLRSFLAQAGMAIKGYAFETLEGFAVPEHPITRELVDRLGKQTIRCDSLRQPRYLDPYLLAMAVRNISPTGLSANSVPVESYTRHNPEDMYSVSILSRTYLYLVHLREKEEEQWFYGIMSALSELVQLVDPYIADLHNIKESLAAEQFNTLAIRAIDNPALEESLLSSIAGMTACTHKVEGFLSIVDAMHGFYMDVVQALADTFDAIVEAYGQYCEVDGTTF